MARPQPVLLMARELNLGGSERQLTELARKLDRSLFEPHIGCFRPGGLRADELRAGGLPVACFHLYSLMSSSALAAAYRISRYLRAHGIRLVHSFDYPTNIYVLPVARACSSAAVVSSQRAHRELTPGVWRHLLRINDRVVDGVVVNCQFLKRHLVVDEKVPAGLVHLCYNGIDTEVFRPAPAPRPPALQDAVLVIGVVCALRPEKDLRTLLGAFARIRTLLAGLRLVIVGSGPCLPELQAQARDLGIVQACVFEGATPDVVPWLRAIDIFVLPSLSEGLSNAIMEAMACGCCVVASRAGGTPELIAHLKRGLLFQTQDVEGLASALRLLIQQEDLRKDLAAAGLRFIQDGFSLEAAAQHMGEIYSSVLNGT